MANFPNTATAGTIHTDASGRRYQYQAVGAWKRAPEAYAISNTLFNLDVDPNTNTFTESAATFPVCVLGT